MKRITIVLATAITAVVLACSHKSTTNVDGPPGGGDGPRSDGATTDGGPPDGPPGTFQLTVKNYMSWCSVQVGSNGTFTTTTPQTVNVSPGVVDLVAKRASALFELGSDMWHHVDGTNGDTGISGIQMGAGPNATSTARVTLSTANKCVWVCCPFAGTGSGCDPTSIGDQCP